MLTVNGLSRGIITGTVPGQFPGVKLSFVNTLLQGEATN